MEDCNKKQGIVFINTDIPVYGNPEAPIEIVFWGDFQCPYTKTLWEELEKYSNKLEKDDKDDQLRIHFRHFPIWEIHNRAMEASLAGAASYEQGNEKFWDMFPKLLTTGVNLTDEHIQYYALTSNLDMDQFNEDLQSEKVNDVVMRDRNLAITLGLEGTPVVYLCGVKMHGDTGELLKNLDYLIYGD